MSSLLKLACCREGVVDPNGDSKMGAETKMRGGDWQHSGGGRRGPSDGIGGGDRATGGGLEGVPVRVRTRMTTSERSARGSVWTETDK